MQNLAIFIVLTFIIALGGVGAVCPAAYVDLGTGCYRFTVQENINWDQAYFICQLENNGYLVEIESEQEQNNLRTYIELVIDPTITYDWWIGLGDILTEGDYRWMTSGNKATYLPWYGNDPNDDPPGEDCVAISTNFNFLWRDYWCDIGSYEGRVHRAICETAPIE